MMHLSFFKYPLMLFFFLIFNILQFFSLHYTHFNRRFFNFNVKNERYISIYIQCQCKCKLFGSSEVIAWFMSSMLHIQLFHPSVNPCYVFSPRWACFSRLSKSSVLSSLLLGAGFMSQLESEEQKENPNQSKTV